MSLKFEVQRFAKLVSSRLFGGRSIWHLHKGKILSAASAQVSVFMKLHRRLKLVRSYYTMRTGLVSVDFAIKPGCFIPSLASL